MMSTDTGSPPPTTPARSKSATADVIARIQSEYREMPGLKLTEAQARRLWGIDARTCALVLNALVEQRFLRRTPAGRYLRRSN